jgi:predicted nucleic acid-binding protein
VTDYPGFWYIDRVKLRLYLDTSVVSALGDPRSPDRQDLTEQFFRRITDYECSTSDVMRQEIQRTRDAQRRESMLRELEALRVFAVTEEAQHLADRYVSAGIFSATVRNDALHVAVAVLERQDVLVSWNFKHLVNRKRRAAVAAVNLSLGLPTIEILPPPEV